MALDAKQFRSFVENLLHSDRSRTEREVKAAAVKALKVNPREVGASVIRDVRKKMGIDRPSALSHARAILAKDPKVEARKVIDAIRERFGIRLGPPDVSRLRPRAATAGRGRRPASAVRPAAKAAGATPARGRRPTRRGRRVRKASAAPVASSATVAPAKAASKRRRGRPAHATVPTVSAKGEISMTFEGKGSPADLAAFFLSLSSRR
jgi:hypothetical protein